jgi:hypothetical protein
MREDVYIGKSGREYPLSEAHQAKCTTCSEEYFIDWLQDLGDDYEMLYCGRCETPFVREKMHL